MTQYISSSSDILGKDEQGCSLFKIRQYECQPQGYTVTCWPLDRIFRQCGQNAPAVEVTNVVHTKDGKVKVDPLFIAHPPRGKNWADIR
ncbi:hypothetical protein M231_01814 [Tremella mesenterica]|uniref:Uncharacterized protein n=1 Tax=Tremella mesenterica TaxID=5217 RepID=A0A4Q1BSM0_TREME|nr:hypothetical protein M231_01814 [Tremella mesenterica]